MIKTPLKTRILRLIYPNNAQPNWKALIPMMAIVFIILIFTYLLGMLNQVMVFIIPGVMIVSIVALKIPFKIVARLDIIAIIIIGLSFFTAAITLSSPIIALIFLLIWIFASTILNILGKAQGALGFIGLMFYFMAAMILVNNQLPPVQWALMAMAGAVIGSLFILILRLLQRDKNIREITAQVLNPEADQKTIVLASTLFESRHDKFSSLAEIGRLLALSRLPARKLEAELETKEKTNFKTFLDEVDSLSTTLSQDILKKQDNELDLTRLNEYYSHLTSTKKVAGEFIQIFEKAQKIIKEDLILESPPFSISYKVSTWDRFRANFNLKNMYVLHGISFALAVGISFFWALITPIQNAYWVPLTIMVVLKPDITSTAERMIIRVGATIIGVILAIVISSIFIMLGLNFLIPLLVLAMLALIIAYMNVSYSYVVIAATIMLIFLESPYDVTGIGMTRLIDILVGSLIAFVVAYVILPGRTRISMPEILQTRMQSTMDYIRSMAQPAAFNDMLLTHNNLEAGINKIKDSFDDAGEDIDIYQDIAQSLDSLSADLIALFGHYPQITSISLDSVAEILGDLKEAMYSEVDFDLIKSKMDKIKDSLPEDEEQLKYMLWILSDLENVYDILKIGKEMKVLDQYTYV